MNKDIIYIVSLLLIIINYILYNKTNLPLYIHHPIFKLIFMICLVVILEYNIYIGFFIAMSYLIINNYK